MSTNKNLKNTFPLLMKNAEESSAVFGDWSTGDVNPFVALGYTMQAVEQLIKRVQELEKNTPALP